MAAATAGVQPAPRRTVRSVRTEVDYRKLHRGLPTTKETSTQATSTQALAETSQQTPVPGADAILQAITKVQEHMIQITGTIQGQVTDTIQEQVKAIIQQEIKTIVQQEVKAIVQEQVTSIVTALIQEQVTSIVQEQLAKAVVSSSPSPLYAKVARTLPGS